jgi:F-type H+-transporting ATPase subunit gamma
MPSLIDLRRRIRSVKNTQQITRAMKMVAAARLRRAQDRILAARPYAVELRQVIAHLASRTGPEGHPLLAQRGGDGRSLLVVVSGDKGLCGSFNSNVLRRAEKLLPEIGDVELMLLGKKGADFFRRRRWPIRAAHRALFSNVTYEAAEEIAHEVAAAFVSGSYDSVFLLYNQFVSVIQQKLTYERLLPLSGLLEELGTEARGVGAEYLFEPSAEAILEAILPRFVVFQIYRVLLESQAAEHGARMTAMESATKNASELIDRLTLTYNRSRQAHITKELIEVVSGAQALAG